MLVVPGHGFGDQLGVAQAVWQVASKGDLFSRLKDTLADDAPETAGVEVGPTYPEHQVRFGDRALATRTSL